MARKSERRMLDRGGGIATLLGEGSSFNGDFTGRGSFIVSGEVVGDCDIDGTLTLARSGHWRGNIRARAIIIAGKVDGEVIAEGQLELSPTARVSGSVTGSEIAIAEGAVIDGGVHVTGGSRVTRFQEKRQDAPD